MRDVHLQSRTAAAASEPSIARRDRLPGSTCPLGPECRDWQYQSRYREAMHRRSMEREARLKEEVAELREENRKLQQEVEDLRAELALKNKLLFAPSTEKQQPGDEKSSPGSKQKPGTRKKPRRRRGHQPGAKGHGRRSLEHLPAESAEKDLPEDEKCCSRCGLSFEPFPPDEEFVQVEVEVRAYRRVYRRKKYRRTCRCPDTPGVVTPPPPPALIPKGRIGVSVWIWILLDKYYLLRPTYRLLKDLAGHGLFLAQGTVTGGLRRLLPLFEPLYLALREKCLAEDHWHADETGWLVFEPTEDGKKGRRRYLWVFHSPSAVFYILDRSRGSEVPRAFFDGRANGVISADRYSAYKSLMKDGLVLVAYCWAHMRRDFVRVRDTRPKYANWAQGWVDRIAKLYELNHLRLTAASEGGDFTAANEELRLHLLEMESLFEEELAEGPPKARKKVLQSLKNHWDGLTLFFSFPEIPPDNNAAERLLRSPVVGRKNYYGSGSEWSGRLASMMYSIIQTLFLWDIEPRKWLTWYLEECARLRGRPPKDIAPFLPWNLTPDEREKLSAKVPPGDTS